MNKPDALEISIRYPLIILHQSYFGQLAIGSVMTGIYPTSEKDDYETAEMMSDNCKTFNKYQYDNSKDSYRCLVAMYIEQLYSVYDWDGFDADLIQTEIKPSCHSLVLTFHKHTKFYTYLKSTNFPSNLSYNSIPDLKEAYSISIQGILSPREKKALFENLKHPWDNYQEWKIVSRKKVPGYIRERLHETTDIVNETLDSQFGQNREFFKRKKRK